MIGQMCECVLLSQEWVKRGQNSYQDSVAKNLLE